MPSADPGAPALRPADVERWLSDLGLEPVDRADRDGIASWDLVLDGRRRFDLRVTIILDPTLALICWAHFAPPINDMFRKSYRKLLRWNDEFPFAKFAVSEDERPLLPIELPIADTPARRPRSARAGAGPHRRHRRPVARGVRRLAVDRREDARPVGSNAAQRRPVGTVRGPPRRAGRRRGRRRATPPQRATPRRAIRRPGPPPGHEHRRLARLVLAFLIAVVALAGALPATAPRDVRAATPDLAIVSDAHYDVQPSQHRVRVTLDLTLTNRLHDTTTKRYFFDHAFLAVLPGATATARAGPAAAADVSVARRTASYTLLRLNLAKDLSSGKTATVSTPVRSPRSGRAGDA